MKMKDAMESMVLDWSDEDERRKSRTPDIRQQDAASRKPYWLREWRVYRLLTC
jgi:hypothetical protein